MPSVFFEPIGHAVVAEYQTKRRITMSRLTVTEKEHWKSRIEKRINRAIEQLEASHAEYFASVRAEAQTTALKDLGVEKQAAIRNRLKTQQKQIERELEEAEAAIEVAILGGPERKQLGTYYSRSATEQKIKRATELVEERLLAASDLGIELRRLREERESLLDTVWLATSSKQIRDLWCRVSEVLGETPTRMQEQLLSVDSDCDQ
jgi:hypothetical protein